MSADPKIESVERRSVLQGLAAAALAASLPSMLRAQDRGKGRTAVVIGAGIAGLSAAYDLRKAGFDVSIFEKWDFTGGRMREAWMGPLYGYTHAQGVLTANKEMFALATELGLAGQLNGLSGGYPVENEHGAYELGLRFKVKEVMKIPGMSAETKKKLPLLQADLDKLTNEVDPCLIATSAAYDDESLGDYYDRMLGKEAAREVIRYWIDPVLEAWGWPAYQTSKAALLPWFSQQKARFVIPNGGIGVLTSKLGSMLPVQNRTAVRYVTPPDTSGRHTVHYLTPKLERRSVTPDVVVCATEGKYVASLIQGLTPQQESFFKSIDFTKEAIVRWVLDKKYAPAKEVGGTHIPTHPDPMKRRAQWSVEPAYPEYYNRPPTANITLTRAETPKWQASGKTMPEYCAPILKHFYPAFDERHVVDIVNYTCDDLIYIPVGYARQVAAVLREQEKERRGLYFAGEYMSGGHTGAACASGRSVAKVIAKHWI